MNYQRILIGAAIGSAIVGLGFLAFHPRGKNIRRKVADIGLDAADKIIDMLRTSIPTGEEEMHNGREIKPRQRTGQTATES